MRNQQSKKACVNIWHRPLKKEDVIMDEIDNIAKTTGRATYRISPTKVSPDMEQLYFELEDKVELVGLLHQPSNETKEVVISVHGMQSNCFKKREYILAKNIRNQTTYIHH